MDRHNNLPELPEDIESYDADAFGRAADAYMDSAMNHSDAAWQLERAKAHEEYVTKWLPLAQLARRQAQ